MTRSPHRGLPSCPAPAGGRPAGSSRCPAASPAWAAGSSAATAASVPRDCALAGGPNASVLRGALAGWCRPRCPPAWSQGRTTGSLRGHRTPGRPFSPLRPARLPCPLLRWERTARDPPSGRHPATSSPGTSRRTLPAASQATSRPVQPPTAGDATDALQGGALKRFGSVRDLPGHAHGLLPFVNCAAGPAYRRGHRRRA